MHGFPISFASANVNMNIPNAELIRAVLDGQVAQVTPNEDGWTDMDPTVAVATLVRAAPGLKFRLKPRTLVQWLPVYRKGSDSAGLGNVYVDRAHIPRDLPAGPVVKVIRLELDAETLEPLSATAEPFDASASAPAQRMRERERAREGDREPAPIDRAWADMRAEA
jgi:hypothetical protein